MERNRAAGESFFSTTAGITLIVCVAAVLVAGAFVGVVLATRGGSGSPGITDPLADYLACLKEAWVLIDDTPFATDLSQSATPKEIAELREGLAENRDEAKEIRASVECTSASGNWE